MSENDNNFVADKGCDVASNADSVRLTFLNRSGKSCPVVVRREDIPQILVSLHNETSPGQVVPIAKGSMKIGANYQIEGQQFRKNPDGSVVLTLFVNLLDEGRVVTFALDIPAKEKESLSQYLSS